MYPEFAENFCKNLIITYNLRDESQSTRKRFDRHKLLRMSSSLNKDRYGTAVDGSFVVVFVPSVYSDLHLCTIFRAEIEVPLFPEAADKQRRSGTDSVSRSDSNPIDRRQSGGSRSRSPLSVRLCEDVGMRIH